MLTERATRLADKILQYPKRVLAASLVMTIVAVALGVGVEFRTSRRELASKDDPDQRRYERLMEELEGTDPVVVALESVGGQGGADALRIAADRIAAALSDHPSVESVFHKVDLDWVLDNGVHLAPPEAIEQIAGRLRDLAGEEGRLEISSGFVWLNDALAGLVRSGLEAGPAGGGGDAAGRLEGLAKLLDAELLREESMDRVDVVADRELGEVRSRVGRRSIARR